MVNSAPVLNAKNFKLLVGPKSTITWSNSRSHQEIEESGQIPFIWNFRIDASGNLTIRFLERSGELENSDGQVEYQRELESIEIPIIRLRITEQGISGTKSDVLPRGRLSALMKYVEMPDQMYSLCWAVLRRYSATLRHPTNPSCALRRNASKAIRTAQKRAGTNDWLCRFPTGFWTDSIPESDSDLWTVSQPVVIKGLFKNKNIRWQNERLLSDLLDPIKCPASQIYSS